MKASSQWVKVGGLFTFALFFIFVLLKDRDVVTALTDASIACVIVTLALRSLDRYLSNLQFEVTKRRLAEKRAKEKEEEGDDRKGSLSNLIKTPK